MNDKWSCWYQKMKGLCHEKEINQFTYEIETAEQYLKTLEEHIGRFQTALQNHYVTDLMKIHAHYVDGYALTPETDKPQIKQTQHTTCPCHLDPNTCQGILWYKTHLKEGLRRKVYEMTNTYNQLLCLCKKLQYFRAQNSQSSSYEQCFLQLVERQKEKLLFYSSIGDFIKGLPEKNTGRLYLFTTLTRTQEAPVSFVTFTYAKGSLTINDFCIPAMHQGIEAEYIAAVEAFAKMISPILENKRMLPITQIQGELGVCRYALSATLRAAYRQNCFQSQGIQYPDGTYLPQQNFIKYL